MSRTQLAAVVSRQLPEFVREDYPTFVAFVEAYYEYLQANQVDLKDLRDIDNTLDSYITYFKKELAYNLPKGIVSDEKFLLQHIKDQYLSKGSQASYKLLFRILFGKNVELTYPGQQMLVASDGRWNQEISVFAQIEFGTSEDIVGKLVDIQTGGKILRVLVDRKEELTGEVDRVVKIGDSYELPAVGTIGQTHVTVSSSINISAGQLVTGIGIAPGTKVVSVNGSLVYLTNANIGTVNNNLTFSNEVYEFFLDKRFFGTVNSGDIIRYKEQFQARILPATQGLKIVQPGRNFRVGQVFELKSGAGTGALMKVTKTDSNGGIKYAEFIKFGIGYTSDFAISILATNSVTSAGGNIASTSSSLVKRNTYVSTTTGTLTSSSGSTAVTGAATNFGSVGGAQVGDELWTTDSTPLLIGVVKSIADTTHLTLVTVATEYESGTAISGTYTGTYTFRNVDNVGDLYTPDYGDGATQAITNDQLINDRTLGFNEQGYVNMGDYASYDFIDAAYAGTIIREFSLNYRNAQTSGDDPAIISIQLGALQKYPGYFTSNNGFLDDAIFIQDSKYYQAFSYVIRIDERLNTYKTAVKTMLHPAGMALFGEFNITNTYDLSVALESLVKSLGIGLESEFFVTQDIPYFTISKELASSISTPLDNTWYLTFSKALESSSEPIDTNGTTVSTTKSLGSAFLNDAEWDGATLVGTLDTNVATIGDSSWIQSTSKALGSQNLYNGSGTENTRVIPSDSTFYFGLADDANAGFTKALGSGHYLYGGITTQTTSVSMTDVNAVRLNISKALTTDDETIYSESGKVWLNSYQGQDYYSQEYSVGLEETFT